MKLAIKNDKPWEKCVKFEAHQLTLFEFCTHKFYKDFIKDCNYMLSLNDYMYYKTITAHASQEYVQAYDEQSKDSPRVE